MDEFLPRVKVLTNLLRALAFPVAVFITNISWGLGIPVDLGGLWTFKNHFFHSLNSVYCVLTVFLYDQQDWQANRFFLPILYGVGYAGFQFALQSNGEQYLY